MVLLPLEPKLSAMLLAGIALRCLDPVIALVSMLNGDGDIFVKIPTDMQENFRIMKQALAAGTSSDHFLLIRLMELYTSFCSGNFFRDKRSLPLVNLSYYFKIDANQTMKNDWCANYHVSAGKMQQYADERAQLLVNLASCGFSMDIDSLVRLNTNSKDFLAVKAAMAAGFYPLFSLLDKSSKKNKDGVNNRSIISDELKRKYFAQEICLASDKLHR